MKFTVAFLVVALCSSLGSVSGDNADNQEQQGEISKEYAGMLGFMYQGSVCLFNAMKNVPAEKKAEKYKFAVQNIIKFVEFAAAHLGMESASELFSDPTDLQNYQQLRSMAMSGDFSNIDQVESAAGGLLTSLAGGLGGFLENHGLTITEALKTVTGLLDDIKGDLPGGLSKAVGDVLGRLPGR